MSKVHEHIPSGKHNYKFSVEARTIPHYNAGKPDGIVYVVVESERRFELGPWFAGLETASEMAIKAERGDQFCNAIPCVDYGTTIPRPDGSWYRPQEYAPRGV